MKCISRAFGIAVWVAVGFSLETYSADGQANGTSSDPVVPDAKLLRAPSPGALRSVPAGFTRPAPTSLADLRGMEKHIKNLISRTSASVVGLDVGSSEGSGVVISPEGLVLTAGHVIRRPGRDVTITFPDGKTARGRTLGALDNPDCGLLRISDPGPWPYTEIAGPRQASPGDWVIALGHPGGFEAERPIVARFGRVVEVSNRAVRTECTIITGDSGGPLLDMHGRVLGIHSYISAGFDDNYHIPITKFIESWSKLAGSDSRPPASTDATAVKLN